MSSLILTLGSNPLPIVVSALQPDVERVFLVTTEDMMELAMRVKELLENKVVETLELSSEMLRSPQTLERKLKDSELPWESSDLNYTGGTKLMVAMIHQYWRKKNPNGTSYYLSEGGVLVSSGPQVVHESKRVDESKLSLKKLVHLHFAGDLKSGSSYYKKEDKDKETDTDTPQLVLSKAIGKFIEKEGWESYRKLLPPYYPYKVTVKFDDTGSHPQVDNASKVSSSQVEPLTCINLETRHCKKIWLETANAMNKKNFKKDKIFATYSISELGKKLDSEDRENTESVSPDSDGGEKLGFKEWKDIESVKSYLKEKESIDAAKFLSGEWLEVYFAAWLKNLKIFDEIHQDVKCRADKGAEFQADVIAVKGYRTYLFSCTTDMTPVLCKSKLFEGIQRVSLVGGEYARVGLICMSSEPVEVLRQVREDGWSGYDGWRVFGEKHLKGKKASCKLDKNGEPGEEKTLKEAIQEWVG